MSDGGAAKKRFWKVRCSILKTYQSKSTATYRSQATVGVVSGTAEGAIAAVRAMLPDTVIYAVNDHGFVGIDDS